MSPEQPAEDSGSAASSANQPSPYDLRKNFESELDGTPAALARLQQAEHQHAFSLSHLQIRRQQLQEEEKCQWRLLKIVVDNHQNHGHEHACR